MHLKILAYIWKCHKWQRKQLKIMKDKADHSRGRGKGELTQAYKSYADYAFPEK